MRSVESEYIKKVVFFNEKLSRLTKKKIVSMNPFQSILPKV